MTYSQQESSGTGIMQLDHFIILATRSRFTVVREKMVQKSLSQLFQAYFAIWFQKINIFLSVHACTVYLHICCWAHCMYELICPPLLLFYWNFSFIQYSEIMEQIDRDVKCTTLTCISSVQMPIAVSSTKLVRNTTKT